jgi:hypothetical protein
MHGRPWCGVQLDFRGLAGEKLLDFGGWANGENQARPDFD